MGKRPTPLPALVDLVVELIDIPSISGHEAQVTERCRELLEQLGLNVRAQEVEPGRSNLLATMGDAPSEVILCTHLDTVPPHFAATRNAHGNGERINGRGASDTRGAIASMLHAAAALYEAGETRVGFLLLVGEEFDHCGAIAARGLGLAPRACIVGEPTDCLLASAQKGMLKVRLAVSGKAGHSAYPEMGRSALHPLIVSLARMVEATWPGDERLGITDLNVGLLGGGVAANVFAPHAEATVMFRLATSLDRVRAQLRDLLESDVEVKEITANEPQLLATLPDFQSTVVAFNTDIAYLALPATSAVFLYGPGSIRVAHSADEFVDSVELERAVVDYQRIIKTVLAPGWRRSDSRV